jgi:hypothetical protein
MHWQQWLLLGLLLLNGFLRVIAYSLFLMRVMTYSLFLMTYSS